MSSKTCPGNALYYDAILSEVAEVRTEIDKQPALASRSVNFPFDDRARAVWQIVKDLDVALAERGIN
jgi:hypothetical protein